MGGVVWWGVSGHRRARFFAKKSPLGELGASAPGEAILLHTRPAAKNVTTLENLQFHVPD